MKKIIRLTESDLVRLVKRVIQEQIVGAKVEKVFISTDPTKSYVTLSNGETYKKNTEEGEFPTMSYPKESCTPGTYTGDELPKYCIVAISLKQSETYRCDSQGCKKL